MQKYNSKLKSAKTFAFLLAILTFNFYLFTLPEARAASSNNDNFNIEIQNIDTAPENLPASPASPRGVQLGEPEIIKSDSKKAPKTELKQEISPLSFSISDNLIDFGLLVSGNPSKRKSTLYIENKSIGYQIQAFEDHPLSGLKQIMADTTCDNGSCSEIRDAGWINELTYGFGYSTNNNTYKQFADISKHEKPQTIISSQINKVEIIFKANIGPSQKPEDLSNTITFIAIPNF